MSDNTLSLHERYAAAKSLRQLLACVRDYEFGEHAGSEKRTKLRLALTGNYSTQFLAKGFPLAMALRGFDIDLYESPYNQWQIDLLDGSSALYEFKPTHVLLALTSIELAYSSLRSADRVASAIKRAVFAALKTTEAQIILTLPEPLADEILDSTGGYVWRKEVCDSLRASLTQPRVTLFDLEPVIRTAGANAWYDERFYDIAKLPFHPDLTANVLGRLAEVVVASLGTRCKLIITDLDDTLWGGRVGDEGWDGLDLDPAGPGRHFLRLQAFLSGMREKGVLLAIASKNDPAPVQEAFANRQEMMLKLDDFVAREIHWEPKSESVAHILKKLNLSTAGIVFLDDNPAERAEVRHRFPELLIPELSNNPAERVPALITTGIFEHRGSTRESLDRNRMYAENAKRSEALRSVGNIDDFLRDLDMTMESIELESARDRVVELIQKTNQFSTTTRRHTWTDLAEKLSDGFGRCYRLKDKFGDNGIISVVVVSRDSETDARVDLWVMSCRVLGRKVEEAILADISQRARAMGSRRLVGEYIPSPKNEMVRNLYPRLGFSPAGEDNGGFLFELTLSDPTATAGVEFIRPVERTAVSKQ